MEIIRGRASPARPTRRRTATFTGTVWNDRLLSATAEGNTIGMVTFAPGARTYWHTHARGQVLVVSHGVGLVCTRGAGPQLLRAGDVVWTPADEPHWHGAGPDTLMAHLAVSLGDTEWLQEVTDEEYRAGTVG